jgi:hypothetical protein
MKLADRRAASLRASLRSRSPCYGSPLRRWDEQHSGCHASVNFCRSFGKAGAMGRRRVRHGNAGRRSANDDAARKFQRRQRLAMARRGLKFCFVNGRFGFSDRRQPPHRCAKLVAAGFAAPPMTNLIDADMLRLRRRDDQILTSRTEQSREIIWRDRTRRRCPVVFHATVLGLSPQAPCQARPCRSYGA